METDFIGFLIVCLHRQRLSRLVHYCYYLWFAGRDVIISHWLWPDKPKETVVGNYQMKEIININNVPRAMCEVAKISL